MSKVILDISVSVDGFATGPNVGHDHLLGEGGDRLHAWIFSEHPTDRAAADRMFATAGAVVLGRRMFDLGEGPWGADGTYRRPCFVVTHREREPLVKGPTTFTFVTDGPEGAVERARAAAGDADVVVVGGPDVARQCLERGLVDEVRLHLVTLLLGAGTRLFERGVRGFDLERTAVVGSPLATHLTFRVTRHHQDP